VTDLRVPCPAMIVGLDTRRGASGVGDPTAGASGYDSDGPDPLGHALRSGKLAGFVTSSPRRDPGVPLVCAFSGRSARRGGEE